MCMEELSVETNASHGIKMSRSPEYYIFSILKFYFLKSGGGY